MKQKKVLDFKLTQKEDLEVFMESLDSFRNGHDLDYKIYFDLKICLEEVIINIFKHGQGNEKRELRVDVCLAWKDNDTIVTEIRDNAIPFNIVEMDSGVDFQSELEERPIGGVGIHLVKNLSDGLEYEQLTGGNKVVLYKKTGS